MAKTRMVKVADIEVGTRHRKQLNNIDSLADSIADIGLFHPIVVTPDMTLIAGQRRLEAYRQRKWKKIAATTVDLDDIVRGELAENFEREDFTLSEKHAIGEAGAEREQEAAKERQGERTDLEPSVDSTESKSAEERQSRTRIAKSVGLSWQAYQRIGEVIEAAEAEPEKYEKLKEEMDSTGRVAGVYKKLTVARQVEQINDEPPPLPEGPYRTIIADPPWTYSGRASDASHRSANPYASMTIDDIKAYMPKALPHKDCVLWLWTTNAHMREAFDVLDAWGFEHKTILTWDKEKMGTGDWLRGQTEHCLLAVRGKPTITLTNQTTLLKAKAGKHSAKPDEFYDLVFALCPGSKVELFQRTAREGIVGAGLEA